MIPTQRKRSADFCISPPCLKLKGKVSNPDRSAQTSSHLRRLDDILGHRFTVKPILHHIGGVIAMEEILQGAGSQADARVSREEFHFLLNRPKGGQSAGKQA